MYTNEGNVNRQVLRLGLGLGELKLKHFICLIRCFMFLDTASGVRKTFKAIIGILLGMIYQIKKLLLHIVIPELAGEENWAHDTWEGEGEWGGRAVGIDPKVKLDLEEEPASLK